MEGVCVKFHTLNLQLEKNVIKLSVMSNDGEKILHGVIGTMFSETVKFVDTDNDNILEAEIGDTGRLTICHKETTGIQHRYDLKWLSDKSKELRDSFHISDSHWYGGAHVRRQPWPIEQMDMEVIPFVSGNSFKDGDYGGVQERYFLSSKGVALFIDPLIPLFVGMNGSSRNQLILSSKYEWPYQNHHNKSLSLSYTILQGENMRTVHDFVAKEYFSKPLGIPDERLFRYPIWSTWAIYKKNISQKIVLQFADEILSHGFTAAQLEIDDDWTPRYGDMEFDKRKFENPCQMIEKLKEKGFRVTLWVHPFASPMSYAARHKFWVSSPWKGYTTWWNGFGKSLDVTNPAAVAWFKGCLQALREKYGVTSYKFDAGEIHWLPSGFSTHAPMETPNEYSKLYAEMCYSIDEDLRAQEVRVGVQTQHLPVFVRMMDKDSCWGCDNGLKTLIPHALVFGVIGYSFLLPDMVGGNAYHGLPDRELYIRWIEANALLPCVQISIPPWKYDEEVVEISRRMLKLHESYADLMLSLAKESTVTGAPIVRPLWWVAPEDETSQIIDSEFLLGDDILVAPVLDPGQNSRSIYLPSGKWKCQLTGNSLEGGQWYEDYPAKLEDLPYFTRCHS